MGMFVFAGAAVLRHNIQAALRLVRGTCNSGDRV